MILINKPNAIDNDSSNMINNSAESFANDNDISHE